MEHAKFKWCREAIEQVRFKPDREKIRDELMGHIEDCVDAMIERGCAEEEAESQAVAAMGDPVTVGKQLDAVHKPWLGWLWRISRWLLWTALFGALLFTILFWYDVTGYFDGRYLWMKSDSAADEWLDRFKTDRIWDVNASGALDDYTFCVDRAAWNSTSEETGTLRIQCRVGHPWYQPKPSLSVIERFCFVDEHGNRWVDHGDDGIDSGEYWVWDYSRDDWFSWTAGIGISDVPEDTEWLELCYDYAGRKMTIRIDLTGGEEP